MKENNKKEIDIVKIYWSGLNILGDDIPRGPRLHTILKDWKNSYYEVFNEGESKITGKIKILSGDIKNLSKISQNYFKKNPKPDKTIKVYKKQFLEAIKQFTKENQGKKFHLLNFSKNCIGFKNYVLDKSKI